MPHRNQAFLAMSGISEERNYYVSVTMCGQTHFLGYFANKEEAIKAKVAGEQKYFGPLLSNQ